MENPYATDIDAIGRIDAVQKILEVVCRTTGLGFSAVARVTDTHWIACAVRDEIAFGLAPGGELKLETTICNEIRQHHQAVVIDHVAEDECFRDHPTPKLYGFQSYISVPITLPGGEFFGTLCAIDPRPARLSTPGTVDMFKLFAELIATHLAAQDRLAANEAALLNEREAAHLREQFIAVLGHDLRNPLSAITTAVAYLNMLPRDEDMKEVLDIILRSTARMTGLIEDVLDFARGRLGGGLSIRRSATPAQVLADTLDHAITELATASPSRIIRRNITLSDGTISCDARRIAQMLSNLLANALTHGRADGPITVDARTSETHFTLFVANPGEPIPTDILPRLFQPFARGSARPGQQGLGLGLYIASEIARAHGGTLAVASTPAETRFTFEMPRGQS